MQRKSRSAPAQLRIFENRARSAHTPETSELDPELELKFRSGPTTGRSSNRGSSFWISIGEWGGNRNTECQNKQLNNLFKIDSWIFVSE